MKRVEQIIDMARKLSRNQRYDSNSGVQQEVFVQYLNNAQDALVKEISNLKCKFFKKQIVVDIVPNQEKYDYPEDIMSQMIDTIQWTDSISGTYWQPLYKSYTKEKITLQPGYPFAYVPYHDGYYLNPPIQRGKLWVSYERTVKKAQKKAGKIASLTLVGDVLSALSLDTTDSFYDANEINNDFYLCVVDKFGNLKASNIQYDSITAGVFSLSPFTLTSGETLAVGDYVLVGKNTCNIPDFPDICESFLIKYMVYDAKYSDASQWSAEAKQDMADSFKSLSYIFAHLNDDLTQIQISNLDYLGL